MHHYMKLLRNIFQIAMSLVLAMPSTVAWAQATILFDDFNYNSTAELMGNGWLIRNYPGGPGLSNGEWSSHNVSFVNTGTNKSMRLKAGTNVSGSYIVGGTATLGQSIQAEVSRVEEEYKNGTWAARIFFTDAPSTGPDGDTVVQAFFGITRYIEGSEPYSEIDFEYLPNGGWYTGSAEPSMWSGTYRLVDFSDPSNHAVTRTTGSLQGWRDLVMQVRNGRIDFFIDGQHQTGFSGAVAPDYPMFLMFQVWFSNDCFDAACSKRGYLTDSNYREYYQDVDWVYFERDNILSPAEVTRNVQALRSQNIGFIKGNKPTSGSDTLKKCNWWGTIYNICTHIESGWGWQNNADCVGINTCATLQPPYGVIAEDASFSRLIQAEAYNNMSGVQVENTSDTGLGQNVGWIDAGDWMSYYDVTIPTTGSYVVEYRVASINGAQLSLDLNAGDIELGTVDIPPTGGWQSWVTVSHRTTIAAGSYNVGIYALSGGWNLNWFRITRVE